MKTPILKSNPPRDFEEISAEMPNWEAKFLKLVLEEKHIQYLLHTMPNIPKCIENELEKRGYQDFILKEDDWHHFLIPKMSYLHLGSLK